MGICRKIEERRDFIFANYVFGWAYEKLLTGPFFWVQRLSIMIVGIADLQLIISRNRIFHDVENFEKKKYNNIIKEAICNGIFDRKRNG